MNRNRVRIKDLRNGITIYIANSTFGSVDELLVKSVKRKDGAVLVGGSTRTLLNLSGIPSLAEHITWYFTPERTWTEVVTRCKNKAFRWASNYRPGDEPTKILKFKVNITETKQA